MQLLEWFAPLAFILFGMLFGSFANVVIWRLPRGESLSVPGSHCPACDGAITPRDNIPVVSWLVLRGRCRACSARISPRYPAVELLSGLLWLAAWALYGVSIRAMFAVVFFYLLMLLSFIDLDTMRLPNALVLWLAGAGVVGIGVQAVLGVDAVPLIGGSGALANPIAFALVGCALGGLLPLSLSLVYQAVRGSVGLGMGDIKLLAVMGLFLGPYVGVALFAGSTVGALSSVLGSGENLTLRRIPFGPFLALGAILTAAVGEKAVGWYLGLL